MLKYLLFILLFSLPSVAQQRVFTDVLSLQPTSLPSVCNQGDVRYNVSTSQASVCGSSNSWSGLGGGSWGSITGTLSNQTDLVSALALKANLAGPTFTGTITTPISTGIVSSTSGVLGTANLTGDVTSSGFATTVGKINGTALSGLSTGILKNTTTTGVPSIAVAADFPTLNQNTTGTAANVTGTTNSTLTSLTGLTTASSLVSVGTITTGTWSGTTVATNKGGTGQTSVIVAPAASTYAGWDANLNFSANTFIEGYTTTATAAATTTLTISSTGIQYFTGTTTQTVKLPTTSVVTGAQYLIENRSTGVVTVQSSGANTIQAMASGTQLLVTAQVATPTTAANWDAVYTSKALASGGLPVPTSEIVVLGSSGTVFGSTNTVVRRFATPATSTFGSDITYSDSATLGGSFTINTTGVYSMTYCDTSAGNADFFGITRNGSALSTSIQTTTFAQGLIILNGFNSVATLPNCVTATRNLTAADVIRAEGSGTGAGYSTTGNGISFTIIRTD